MYRVNHFLSICIAICFFSEAFGQVKKQISPLPGAGINFELSIQISLFDFPCKVVIFQNNGSGNWDTTLVTTIPTGTGLVKGKLKYEDYVLLKMFPADEPTQVVAMQKMFIQKGHSVLKWDDAAAVFKREESKPDEEFLKFQEQHATLATLKSTAQETGNQLVADSLSKKIVELTTTIFNEHKNDIMGPYVLTTFLSAEVSTAEYEKLVSSLSVAMQNTGWGINAKTKGNKLKVLAIGAPAPAFKAIATDSTIISLQACKGKYVFIDFWASWCGPCIKEFPYVEKLYSLVDTSKLKIISVSTDQSKEKFKSAVSKHPQKWAQILDIDNNKILSEAYDVSRLPSNFLINAKGEIVAKNLRGEELIKTVTDYINSK